VKNIELNLSIYFLQENAAIYKLYSLKITKIPAFLKKRSI